jgi:hypothetical protein
MTMQNLATGRRFLMLQQVLVVAAAMHYCVLKIAA